MSITVKNLRPGVLILADAGLRLGPGETAEIAALTPQIQQAIAAGRLAKLDAESAQPEDSETTAESGEPETAGRRGQKRPPLDALRRKAEEAVGGAS